MKNYGLDLEKEAQDRSVSDYICGSAGERKNCIAEGLDFRKYLPKGEVQKAKEDMMDCATRGPINILETKFTGLVKESIISNENSIWLYEKGYTDQHSKVTFSDAFNAIDSGTRRTGNSLKAPLDSMNNSGLIPKKMLPLEKWMTWSDYHNRNRITQEMRDLGQEFLERFSIYYEVVYSQYFNSVIETDLIDVAGHAWSKPVNGVYPKIDAGINHCFVYFEKPAYYIFDNYIDWTDGDFIKKLASNYILMNYGYRVIINEKPMKTKLYTAPNIKPLVCEKIANGKYWAIFSGSYVDELYGGWGNVEVVTLDNIDRDDIVDTVTRVSKVAERISKMLGQTITAGDITKFELKKPEPKRFSWKDLFNKLR